MKKVRTITRDVLRNMGNGDTVTMTCEDGYQLDSKKNIAYGLQKMEKCKFTCKTNGMTLSVTRLDI